MGLPVASVGPSVRSVFGATLRADNALCLTVSQSGQSPDAVLMTESLAASKGFTVAITNDPKSPLAASAQSTIALHAGRESSVAATKTFVSSIVAGVWLVASLAKDQTLIRALRDLPRQLEKAICCDWSEAAAAVDGASLK